MPQVYTHCSAEFSPCRTYRYALWRSWSDLLGPVDEDYVLFVGLNPSTADEMQDDPTIRRCVSFARAWGYSRLCMANLFAFRGTNPDDMLVAEDPVGPENDRHLIRLSNAASIIIAAWGADGKHLGRDRYVLERVLPLVHYLQLNKDGTPGHPLYLKGSLTPRLLDVSPA